MEDHEIDFKVIELMQELQKMSVEIENITKPFTDIIEENRKKQEEVSAPYQQKYEELQNKIKELTFLRTKSIKTGSGNVTYKKGSVRRNWNLDALDMVCDVDQYVKEKIWKFREEKQSDPQVLIKIETQGKSTMEL